MEGKDNYQLNAKHIHYYKRAAQGFADRAVPDGR